MKYFCFLDFNSEFLPDLWKYSVVRRLRCHFLNATIKYKKNKLE